MGLIDETPLMRESYDKLSNLVERFEPNIEAYRNPAYNETQLRIEFIDPFFEALGWDVANKAGYAEQYKDVIHEDEEFQIKSKEGPGSIWPREVRRRPC